MPTIEFTPTLRPTRFKALFYFKWGDTWRICDADGAPTGPPYRTKMELLGDLERISKNWGY